jgi:hypothetical protein
MCEYLYSLLCYAHISLCTAHYFHHKATIFNKNTFKTYITAIDYTVLLRISSTICPYKGLMLVSSIRICSNSLN